MGRGRRHTRRGRGTVAVLNGAKPVASSLNDGGGSTEVTHGHAKNSESEWASIEAREVGLPVPEVDDYQKDFHPLLNEDILANVFKQIVSKSESASAWLVVGNIRLVCKTWRDSVTRLYRRTRAEAYPGLLPILVNYWTNRARKLSIQALPPFLGVMEKSELIPFQSYQIRDDTLAHGNEKLVKEFLRICGPEMVSLFMVGVDDDTVEKFNLRSLPPNLNLGKLRTIEICFVKSSHDEMIKRGTHGFGNFIGLLLTGAKELREFKFYSFLLKEPTKRNQVVFRQFEEKIAGRIPETLKSLTLHMPIHESTLKTLMERGVKLEEFAFTAHYPLGGKILNKFLEDQAPTLKVLRILKSMPDKLFPDFTGRFEELVVLELQDVEFAKPKPFNFAKMFPKLKILKLKEWTVESSFLELLSCAKKTAPLVEDIHTPFSFHMAANIKRLSECFPNIKTLRVGHSKDIGATLEQVFVYFGNIEQLVITYNSNLNADSVFSGVREVECERIRKFPSFDGVDLKEFQTKPSILNLTKLKTLVVKEPYPIKNDGSCYNNWCNTFTITDLSAHFLFLQMASLRELRMGEDRHWMSRRRFGLLRAKLDVMIMNRVENCAEISDSDEE